MNISMRAGSSHIGRVAIGLFLPLLFSTSARAQRHGPPPADLPDALPALFVAARYVMSEADSLPSVARPSGKALLSRRPGSVAVSVLVNQYDHGLELTAAREVLTQHVVQALSSAGVRAHIAEPGLVNEICRRVLLAPGKARQDCDFADDLALVLSVSYPVIQPGNRLLVNMSVFTDQKRANGESDRVNVAVELVRKGAVWEVVRVKPIVLW